MKRSPSTVGSDLFRHCLSLRRFLSLILLVFSSSSFAALASLPWTPINTSAEDCTEKDFSQFLGPNRSQQDIGWCYANAAADLLTYRFRDELGGRAVSAGYIALAFNDSMFPSFLQNQFEGGFAFLSLILSQSSKYGICPVQQEQSLLRQGPQISLKSRVKNLFELKNNFDLSQGKSLEQDLLKYRGSKSTANSNDSYLLHMPRTDLIELLRQSNSPNNFTRKFADYVCAENKIHPKDWSYVHMDAKYFNWGWRKPLIERIHSQLNKDNISAIGYFSDFFDNDNAPNTDASRHVSVVVGRRWNGDLKRCELKVRNSWGTGCSGYKAESLKKPGVCVAGNIWVSEQVLDQRIFGVTYLGR